MARIFTLSIHEYPLISMLFIHVYLSYPFCLSIDIHSICPCLSIDIPAVCPCLIIHCLSFDIYVVYPHFSIVIHLVDSILSWHIHHHGYLCISFHVLLFILDSSVLLHMTHTQYYVSFISCWIFDPSFWLACFANSTASACLANQPSRMPVSIENS